VDFELTEEQRALRDAAGALLAQRAGPARVREVAALEGPTMDRSLWAAMADQGWVAVEVPDHHGGLGLGSVESALLFEQVGRHLAAVPLVGTSLVAGVLVRALAGGVVAPDQPIGSHDVSHWLTELVAGRAIGAVAWGLGGPGSGAGHGAQPTDAQASGTQPTGAQAAIVPFGPVADVVVAVVDPAVPRVVAWAPDGDRRLSDEPTVDLTRCAGWWTPPTTGVAPTDGPGGGAVEIGGTVEATELVDRAATAVSAEMLGMAQQVLEMTAAYAGERVQFGQPIGAFQAVKHRCADMVVDVEGMRSLVAYAAWEVGRSGEEAAVAASAAKAWCSDAAARVMGSALQVHGGIGFTWDHDLHLYVKRSLVDQLTMGDARWHRQRLAGVLRGRVEAGSPVL
jgi:alkylation response protein AidB-like acyl-CoA dehydrogenase